MGVLVHWKKGSLKCSTIWENRVAQLSPLTLFPLEETAFSSDKFPRESGVPSVLMPSQRDTCTALGVGPTLSFGIHLEKFPLAITCFLGPELTCGLCLFFQPPISAEQQEKGSGAHCQSQLADSVAGKEPGLRPPGDASPTRLLFEYRSSGATAGRFVPVICSSGWPVDPCFQVFQCLQKKKKKGRVCCCSTVSL